MPKSLLEQFTDAQAEVARLTGVETTLREQFASIPGGDIPAFLTEHTRRGSEETRLAGELATMSTRATTAEDLVASLRTKLESAGGEVNLAEDIEMRAAEMVSEAGVPPAKAEVQATSSADGKTAAQRSKDEHWSHYVTLPIKDKTEYYRAHQSIMDKR